MEICDSVHFRRKLGFLSKENRVYWYETVRLFEVPPLHPELRNHTLRGKYKGKISINVTEDIRAIYIPGKNRAIFVDIGKHDELYL